MTLKNGETANVDEVLNLVGTNFKNQAQLLYNSAYIGFNSKLNVATGVPNLKNVKYDVFNTDTSSTKTNFTYDNTNKYYYQDIGSSNGILIFQTSGLDNITDLIPTFNYLLGPGYSTETTHCDFTAVSLPSGWTTSGANTHSETWDAANDEIDISCSGTSSYSRFNYSTSVTEGVVKVGIRNIAHSTNEGYTSSTGLTLGSNYISLEVNRYAGANRWRIVDSLGNATSYTAGEEPTTIWFKITISGGRVKTEYSTTGDSNYTQLGLGTALAGGSVYCSASSGNGISVSQSVYNFTIYTTPTYSNTLTVSISADGTNYEEVTDATIHRFTNTGTNLFIKFEIDRVDTSAVDKISEYACLYNLGAS